MTNLRAYFYNDFLQVLLVFTWCCINSFLFLWTFFSLKYDDRFNYIYLICGNVIFLARAMATVINFNCALVLLPMNRIINSWIRCKLLVHFKGSPKHLFNHSKGLHILIAFAISIFSVLHTVFHLVNCLLFRHNYSDVVKEINLEKTRNQTTLPAFLMSIPGWTGLVLLVILVLMFFSSLKIIRVNNNELFRYTHQLSFVFFVIMGIHGFGNVTKYQTNIKEHPKECHNLSSLLTSEICKELPIFQHIQPTSWKWIIGSLVLHLIDRGIRAVRAFKNSQLVQAKLHYGNVIELVFYRKNFKAMPGQYILLQCSQIAEFEWHPFTLTKCPSNDENEDQTFSVHIKALGDWTERLLKTFATKGEKGDTTRIGKSCVITLEENIIPIFAVDGPYGSPNQDCFKFGVNVSIASGIGITPFAAVLNYLKYYQSSEKKNFKMEKMHLFWVCKSIDEFSWVLKLINEVETHLVEIKKPNLLQCNLFVTRDFKIKMASHLDLFENILPDNTQSITNNWVRARVKLGRPNFKEELLRIALQYEKKKIGLFYCGRKSIGKELITHCKRIKQRNNVFIFNKESFG